MNLTTITPPPYSPVSLTQVYAQLRLDPEGSPATHPDDAMLQGQIATATREVEALTRRSLVQQTLRLSCGGFPLTRSLLPTWSASLTRRALPIALRLLRPPVVRVNSVRYFDGDNALVPLDPAIYFVTDEQIPELRFVSSFNAPTVYDRPDALRIDYVAGYAPDGSPPSGFADYVANVPQSLRNGVLIGVQLLHDDMAPADADKMARMRAAILAPYALPFTV